MHFERFAVGWLLPRKAESNANALWRYVMLAWLEQFLVRYPELALFLVISLGFWIGSFKIKEFSLGPVTGSLFAGIFRLPAISRGYFQIEFAGDEVGDGFQRSG